MKTRTLFILLSIFMVLISGCASRTPGVKVTNIKSVSGDFGITYTLFVNKKPLADEVIPREAKEIEIKLYIINHKDYSYTVSEFGSEKAIFGSNQRIEKESVILPLSGYKEGEEVFRCLEIRSGNLIFAIVPIDVKIHETPEIVRRR